MPTTTLSSALFAATLSTIGLLGCVEDSAPPPDLSEATARHYRVVSIDLPDTVTESRAMGFDLNGDETIDNQVGASYAAFHMIYTTFEVEQPAAAQLTTELGWVLSLYDFAGEAAAARLTLGNFIDGQIQPPGAYLSLEPARGEALAPGVELRGGESVAPLGAISDPYGTGEPGWLTGDSVTISVDEWSDAEASITLGLALPEDGLKIAVYTNLARYFTQKLADPTADFAHELDSDDDGTVTVDEVYASSVVGSLFAWDLDDRRISLGLRLRAEAL